MDQNELHSKIARFSLVTAMLLSFSLALGARELSAQALDRPQTWVDDELFDGVVTSAVFKPTAGFFDELYTGGDGFLDGVGLISDAGPGDTDYNGGRWYLDILRENPVTRNSNP
jgi:hypothetical protein